MPSRTRRRVTALFATAAIIVAAAVPVVASAGNPQPAQIHAQIHAQQIHA